MFTDVEGYSALAQEDEPLAIRTLDKHRELIRPVFARHEGYEVKTRGDAFLVEFGSALDAVECAVEIQDVLRTYNETASDKIFVRAGIHLGDVIHRDGDVYGDAVNIAARIETLARGGEVCISGQVYDHVRNKMPYAFVLLEPQSLKNISVPIDVYKLEVRGGAGSAPSPERLGMRFAVLPLVNLSPDPNDAYLADAMTEELINSISKARSLRVIARTSAMHYKGSAAGIAEIGRSLRVSSVLQGSVLKAGNKVRINVQLIDARTEEHLWAGKYDREMDNIFAIQDNIARRVTNALKVRLAKGKERGKPTGDLDAYTRYLRGRTLLYERTEPNVREARKQFELAIQADPSYAAAYAGLADAHYLAGYYHFAPTFESYSRAKDLTAKALGLDADLAEAHATVGVIKDHYDYDFGGAEDSFKNAIRLNPSYAQAHHWYALALLSMGRCGEALVELEKANEADPMSPIIRVVKGNALYYSGRDNDAVAEWRAVEESNPTFPGLYWHRAFYHMDVLQEEGADADIETWARLSGGNKEWLGFLKGYSDARFGRREAALAAVRVLESASHFPQFVAHIYGAMGDAARFFEWADRCVEERNFEIIAVRYMKTYERIRKDEKFEHLLTKMGLHR